MLTVIFAVTALLGLGGVFALLPARAGGPTASKFGGPFTKRRPDKAKKPR